MNRNPIEDACNDAGVTIPPSRSTAFPPQGRGGVWLGPVRVFALGPARWRRHAAVYRKRREQAGVNGAGASSAG